MSTCFNLLSRAIACARSSRGKPELQARLSLQHSHNKESSRSFMGCCKAAAQLGHGGGEGTGKVHNPLSGPHHQLQA